MMPYPSIAILPIQEQDFDLLFDIEQVAHQVPWSLGTLKNNQGKQYLNFKLCLSDTIIGFAICQFVLDEATLFNLAIHPKHQGKGFGTYLLHFLMQELQSMGINSIWLEVRESNHKARQLYEKLGFNQVDIRKNYYPIATGGRENAVLMACYL